MRPVARYLLADFVRSRAFVAPGLVTLMGIVVLYAQPPNPVLSTAGTVAAWLFAAQCWLALAFFNSQGAPDRHVLAASAGGRAFVAGRMLAAATVAGAVSVVALLYPVVTMRFAHVPDPGQAGVILLANLTATLGGTALAALFGQPLLRNPGVAVLGLSLCALLTVPFELPAGIPTAHALDTTHTGQVPARLGDDLISVLLFTVAVGVVCANRWRRHD